MRISWHRCQVLSIDLGRRCCTIMSERPLSVKSILLSSCEKDARSKEAIYYDVSSVSFERLDKFEGSLYLRTEVPVICDDGESVAAETYVITESALHQLSTEDWSFDRFLSKDKVFFQGGYPGYDDLS